MQDAGNENKRRVIPPADWETAVEKQIREAMERGDFDNLAGRGKPLNLGTESNLAGDWALAFKLLRDAGFAPDWIELDKEIRAARRALLEPFGKYLARLQQGGARQPATEARLISNFQKSADEINRMIDLFNLKAPGSSLHQPRLRVLKQLQAFQDACAAKK